MMTILITPARVRSRLSARDVGHVIDELTGTAAHGAALSHEAVRAAVLERGRASCFGFGRGVAIPHAAIPGLAQPIGAFARLEPAQDFGAADGTRADLAFLLLSPGDDGPTHLRALACVARRLRDREVAARLRSAKDVEAIYIVLTSDAWREPGEDPESGHSATPYPRGLTNGSRYTSLRASC
ncbi:PTS sugar transporter subunit IIA [Microvirga subterranea]|uniref:PTS sugar transporter subunit IIA n=1 Tax=Microvirga subterranea TaxID=186651 RepID=UPI0014744112|nr:PTS sugar transporter subunit IIA [Microvirga subterranea]